MKNYYFLVWIFFLARYDYVVSENLMFGTQKTLRDRTARTNPKISCILADICQVVPFFRGGLHMVNRSGYGDRG